MPAHAARDPARPGAAERPAQDGAPAACWGQIQRTGGRQEPAGQAPPTKAKSRPANKSHAHALRGSAHSRNWLHFAWSLPVFGHLGKVAAEGRLELKGPSPFSDGLAAFPYGVNWSRCTSLCLLLGPGVPRNTVCTQASTRYVLTTPTHYTPQLRSSCPHSNTSICLS